jgi:response regulator RpfG family c-di-GMP phosphodiesterase/Flp pilus assembly protein TadD
LAKPDEWRKDKRDSEDGLCNDRNGIMAKGPDKIDPNAFDGQTYYDSIQGMVSVGEPIQDLHQIFDEPSIDTAPRVVVQDLEMAHQLYETGLLYNFKKEIPKAIETLEKAYGLYLMHRHFLGAIQCLVELALLKYTEDPKDGLSKSTRLFSEALKMVHVHMHEPSVNEVRARLIHYQGLVKYREKQYGEAVRNFMYAKTFCRPDGPEAARIYDSLAVHYERTNDYYRAIQCLEIALKLKQNNGCIYEQAISCQIMGRLYLLREEYGNAANCLSQALQIAGEVGDMRRAARIKNELIRLRIYENNLDEAQRLIAEVEQECDNKTMRIPFGKSQFYKAYIYYIQADLEQVTALLDQEVLPIFNKYHYRKGLAMASRLLACVHHRQHQETRAIEEMSEVIAIFKEEGEIAELGKTYYELGKIYLSLNEQKLALASMMEALRIAESNGLSFLISHIEDEIFRLDERKWQEIVEKRANHDRVFEKDSNLMDALSSLSTKEEGADGSSPNNRLVSLLRVGQAMAAERDVYGLLTLIKNETEMALDADRCTVFIYDRDKNELWSQVATGIDDASEEIRFPAHLGLAGYVVKTGEVLNIKDAYDDPRFNKDIDKKTGYRTQTILCMPMRNRKMEIIGVFQVLNKSAGHFDKVDEDLLTAIATNAGVAIENATLAKEMKISFDSFVKTLSSTIDARDPITAGHSERVAEYAVLVGEEMELQDNDIEALKYASMLHDIGKIGIREDILKKDGRLTEKEYRHIQRHVYYTHEILKNVHFERHLQLVPEIAASHHEKMDGTGYHRGLKGNDILLSGRILAIADVFDAITSRRHYRNRMAFDKVLTIMKRDAGTHFDPDCVDSFFNVPLYRLGRVLLMDRGMGIGEDNLEVLNQLDKHITVGEYYKSLAKKEMKSKGEVDIHRVFSMLYHQTGLSSSRE